jgi:hypothetical protein
MSYTGTASLLITAPTLPCQDEAMFDWRLKPFSRVESASYAVA